MGETPVASRFGEREQGVRDRIDDGGAREDRRRRAALAQHDATLAALDYPDYRGDVFMLIAQAVSIADHAIGNPDFPRREHAGAAKLLANYRELKALAATAPRDREGRLLYYNIAGDLRPWDGSMPRVVEDIPVFSRENVRRWSIIVDRPLPPLEPVQQRRQGGRKPAATQKTNTPAKPLRWLNSPPLDPKFGPGGFVDEYIPGYDKAAPAPPDPATLPAILEMIKTPGMSYLHSEGQLTIYAAVIRALLAQAISDERARAIVTGMGPLDDVSASSFAADFESRLVGTIFSMILQPTFFDKLAGMPEFKDYHRRPRPQRLQARAGSYVIERYPDFTAGERFFFAMNLMVSSDGGPQEFDMVRGRVYYGVGWIFIGYSTVEDGTLLEPTYYIPDGRIVIVVHRDEMLEAFREGVVSASGAVIVAYVEVALALALVFGPEALALAAEGVGGAAVATGEAATATGEFIAVHGARLVMSAPLVARSVVVTTTSVFIWLGSNWERVYNVGQAAYNVGDRMHEKGLKRFFGDLVSGDREDILMNWVALLHDAMEGYSGFRGGGAHTVPDEPDPPRPAAPSRAVTTGQPHVDADPGLSTTVRPTAPAKVATQAAPDHPNKPVAGRPRPSSSAADEAYAQKQIAVIKKQVSPKVANQNRLTDPSVDKADGKPKTYLRVSNGGWVEVDGDPQPAPGGAMATQAAGKGGVNNGGAKGGAVTPASGGGSRSAAGSRGIGDKRTNDPQTRSGRSRVSGMGGEDTGVTITPPKSVGNTNASPLASDTPTPDKPGRAPYQADDTGDGRPPNRATPVEVDDEMKQTKAGKKMRTAPSTPDRTGVKPPAPTSIAVRGPGVHIDPDEAKARGLTSGETEFVEEALTEYALQMKKFEGQGLQPDQASNQAHKATQNKFTGPDYPLVVAEEPTGVTVGTKKTGNLKSSDLQLNRTGADPGKDEGHIAAVIEFKRTAKLYNGDIYVKGRDFQRAMDFTNDQADAYRALAQKGVAVFVGDKDGYVFSPMRDGSGRWKLVGQWAK